jgi:ABC-type dipeptide/oligopeptide/nickel transport system permease component
MTLVFGAVIVASALAVPVALLSLLRRESLLDLVLRRTLMVLQGLPEFFVGLVLVLVFAVSLAWLPSFGASGPAWYVLPIAALAIPLMSSLARLLRAQLLGILHEEFVTALRARGLGPREIVLRHGLRNALPPLIAYLALQLGWLVGGTVIVEVVFGIPGLGELAISATRDRDITVIQAVVVTVAVGYVGFNLLADLIVYTIDPRVRAAYA